MHREEEMGRKEGRAGGGEREVGSEEVREEGRILQ